MTVHIGTVAVEYKQCNGRYRWLYTPTCSCGKAMIGYYATSIKPNPKAEAEDKLDRHMHERPEPKVPPQHVHALGWKDRDKLRQALREGDPISIILRNVHEASVFLCTRPDKDSPVLWGWRCCKRGGHDHGSQEIAIDHLLSHIERIHPIVPRAHAHEDPDSVPDVCPERDTRDDAQQYIPGDVEIPGHDPTRCPNDTTPPLIALIPEGKHQARIYTNRWELFTDVERELIEKGLDGLGTHLSNLWTHIRDTLEQELINKREQRVDRAEGEGRR